jgi:hypothetical protein
VGFVAAPAIVRAGSLMPVKALPIELVGWTGNMTVSNPFLTGRLVRPSALVEMVTTTLDRYREELADNITADNPLLARLRERGAIW